MYPFITVFGRIIPLYFVTAVIGGAAMVLLAVFLAKKQKKIPAEDIIYMLLYAGIGCIIGAKLLYIIISVDVYWYTDKSFADNMKYWYSVLMQGGLVFYGGLAGALLGAVRYTTKFKLPVFEAIETVVPAVPLFHAFGRIGCFLSGCCYGCEYHGLGAVTFSHAIAAPNGVSLFPTQLTEATLNLLLCAALCVIFLKKPRTGVVSGAYLSAYAVIRFCLEFLRGDIIRGSVFGLSTSQWISVFAFAVGIYLIFFKRIKKTA